MQSWAMATIIIIAASADATTQLSFFVAQNKRKIFPCDKMDFRHDNVTGDNLLV